MTPFRIALANLPYPRTPAEAVDLATGAIAAAGSRGADVVCFPECYVPGYRWPGRRVAAFEAAFMNDAWQRIARAAASARVAVVLGTERRVSDELRITALVVARDGALLGLQDKVQLDPVEEDLYSPGVERRLFGIGPATVGVVICHEGWRYPETVRWAARRGAHVVLHPHYGEAEPGSYRPSSFGEAGNTFHERAILCRAAENTCWFASVNCAGAGSPTTSAIAAPDGTLFAAQPYGEVGLLVADLDLDRATGFLAHRLREVRES